MEKAVTNNLANTAFKVSEIGVEVQAFIRNSLAGIFQLEEFKLVLTAQKKKLIARHTFDVSIFRNY